MARLNAIVILFILTMFMASCESHVEEVISETQKSQSINPKNKGNVDENKIMSTQRSYYSTGGYTTRTFNKAAGPAQVSVDNSSGSRRLDYVIYAATNGSNSFVHIASGSLPANAGYCTLDNITIPSGYNGVVISLNKLSPQGGTVAGYVQIN